ncbi:MAG: AAA family ATPase [Pseudomonadota bacterium]
MSTSRGITLGKFLPLHDGHALLLRAAAMHCDELIVLVGVTPDDPYSFEQREQWINSVLNAQSQRRATVRIVSDPDPDPAVAKDAAGTVTDAGYWDRWLHQNATALADVEFVFTSDVYGAEIARRIGARWFPVDPGREVVPVAARQIRGDTHRYFGFVSDAAKPDVAMTVAVVGAESTGKSTLVKALADHYQTSYAPEWGRIISEAHPDLTARDFDHIVSMQTELIHTAQRSSNGLCFTDTEAITTALFAPVYLGDEHAASWQCARAQNFALYLVLDPAVPWINDGTRVLDTAQRLRFHTDLVAALQRLNKPYQIIAGDSYAKRASGAIAAIDAMATTLFSVPV